MMNVSEAGKLGGKACASKRTPEERSAAASKAVKARWAKEKGKPTMNPDEATAFPTCKNYNELRAQLAKLPAIWYPDLIRTLVEAAYEKNVFKAGGASYLVRKIEEDKFWTRTVR